MNGHSILLTGGTGSFGQGFVRRVLAESDISMVRIYSRGEHSQHKMRQAIGSDRVSYFIGDVRDSRRLARIMDGCDWVVHAAALKQSPLGEIESQEFIKTNIFGSMNVIEAAFDCNVSKALLISTDKAVEPINLYGATKMCAEKMFRQADGMRGTKNTRFSVVRYGNVAGTNGSVMPFFMSLPPGEPTPVFDPNATRFWMTLKDANEFVLSSLREMKGGELFIPKLKSVRVIDVAKALRPNSEIVVKGYRVGDKQHETLDLDIATGARYSSDKNDFLTMEEIRNYASVGG